jgi:sulfite reductase (NADPH) flavoprotein alpha-component
MLAEIARLSDARVYAACAVVLLYLATTAYFLWPRTRGRGTSVPVGDGIDPSGSPPTLIAFASQTGFAAEIASRTARSLEAAGTAVQVASLAELSAPLLREARYALFIVSTTGEGDAPDPATSFVRTVLESTLGLAELRYAVLALGDREYDNFCAFGHRIDRWLRHQGAVALFDVVEVDNGDEGALRHWQHQLSVLGNSPDLPDWETPRYERWRLRERCLVNPGSAGDPCFHIELVPQDTTELEWHAGDVAEIDPRNSTWDPEGSRLPHREYSIASLPSDGALHLLVRQMRRPSGELGLGSGWLTAQAAPGDEIAMRIRTNANFRAPVDDRPLILIGNGTGIAGLRALLKARIRAGHRRNWLVFGERNAAHDRFYGSDLERWQLEGSIEQLDLVFSRDQSQRRYVQHRLVERAIELRRWVAEGAAIYVCGSLQGMAPAVDAALREILGTDQLEALAGAGRYRRDVY